MRGFGQVTVQPRCRSYRAGLFWLPAITIPLPTELCFSGSRSSPGLRDTAGYKNESSATSPVRSGTARSRHPELRVSAGSDFSVSAYHEKIEFGGLAAPRAPGYEKLIVVSRGVSERIINAAAVGCWRVNESVEIFFIIDRLEKCASVALCLGVFD